MTPSSLNVTVEQGVATFHCQHNGSDDINWRVNETSPTSPNISPEKVPLGSGFYSSLTIASLLKFNGSTIECVAIFYKVSPPFRFTPPMILLVQGLLQVTR